MTKIIFLNGCGSSGKSSIARAIQHQSPDLWLTFGVDTLIDMIPPGRQAPYLNFVPDQNKRGPCVHVQSGPEGAKLFPAMPQFAELLALRGNNLIIDEVLFDEEALKAYAHHLKSFKVYYIGVFCDLNVMQEREILRQDRCIGLSNDQIDRVHKGALNTYDFTVDTTRISPFQAARLILKFADDTPAPQAFRSLENQKADTHSLHTI
jgi:chloramphenicol 3-O phosphotransferase